MNVSNEVKLMLRSRNEQNKWDLYQMEVFSVGFEVWILTLIVPAKNFQASVKCRKAQKCLYLTLSIQCHMQLKLLMSLTAV